jgi:carboxypeptidase family protein
MQLKLVVRATALLLLAGGTACARYEWVPDYQTTACARVAVTRSGPPLDTARVDTLSAGVVAGRVSDDWLGPVAGAVVVLESTFWIADTTDQAGYFRFSSIPPGTYRFIARRSSLRTTSDSIVVPANGGIRVYAKLLGYGTDGACSGYVNVAVRKPWWKLW